MKNVSGFPSVKGVLKVDQLITNYPHNDCNRLKSTLPDIASSGKTGPWQPAQLHPEASPAHPGETAAWSAGGEKHNFFKSWMFYILKYILFCGINQEKQQFIMLFLHKHNDWKRKILWTKKREDFIDITLSGSYSGDIIIRSTQNLKCNFTLTFWLKCFSLEIKLN